MRQGIVALGGAILLLGGGCSPRVQVRSGEPEATSTAPAATVDALDWDGVRYDYGQIVSARTGGAHGPMIEFDRWQLHDGSGLLGAESMTTEPIVVGNHDLVGENANPRTRRYRVAPEAELLFLDNVAAVCDDLFAAPPPPPQWIPFLMGDLDTRAVPGIEQPQSALTFDDTGQVIRIRVSSGC